MDRDEAEELLRTLFTDPAVARRQLAQDVLVPDPDPGMASIGHQVVGIVVRDLGDTDAALRELRAALRLARRSGDPARAADAMATLGISLCIAGRMREGLRHLDEAAAALDGVPLGRVLCAAPTCWVTCSHASRRRRRPAAGARGSSPGPATRSGGPARSTSRASSTSGLRRARRPRAEAFAEYGEAVGRAGRRWRTSQSPSTTRVAGLPPRRPAASARAVRRGGGALRRAGHHQRRPRLRPVRRPTCRGGLAQDALAVVERALAARPLPTSRAGRPAGGGGRGGARCRRLGPRRVGRRRGFDAACARSPGACTGWGRTSSRSLLATEAGDRPATAAAPGRAARRRRCARPGAPELPQALLLGAGLARRVRSARAARLVADWLDEAAPSAARPPARCARSAGWRWPRRREAAGDVGGVLRACERGLRALDEHQATLGSQELRAGSAGHGARAGRARHPHRHVPRRRPAAAAVVGAMAGHRSRHAGAQSRPRPGDPSRPGGAARPAPPTRRGPGRRCADRRARGARHSARAAGAPPAASGARVRGDRRDPRRRRPGRLRSPRTTRSSSSWPSSTESCTRSWRVAGAYATGWSARQRPLPLPSTSRCSPCARRRAGARAQLDVAGARLERALLGGALDGVGESRIVVSGTAALQGVPWGLLPVARPPAGHQHAVRAAVAAGASRDGPRTGTAA